MIKSLAPERCGCSFKLVISKNISMIDTLSTTSEIALRWMPPDLTD